MECPHCRRDIKYKERSNRRCRKCKREFVFEPRENALRMTDRRLQAIAVRVSDRGKLVYTPEQFVLYASGRTTRRTNDRRQKAAHRIAVVLIITVVASVIILAMTMDIQFAGLTLALGLFLALKAAGKVGVGLDDVLEAMVEIARPILRKDAKRAHMRMTPWEEADFIRDVHTRWQDVYDALPSGMLTRESHIEGWCEPPATIHAALVCPDRVVLQCLHANGVGDRLGLALLPAAAPFAAGVQATLEVLSREPAIPLLVVHDADPNGLTLAQTVRATLGVNPAHRLVDIGLRPRDALKYHLITFHDKPSADTLQRLRKLAAAEAQTGPGPRLRLDAAELKWLKDGHYSPVRALTPKQLIGLVTRAVERATRAAPRPTDEARAEQQAKVLGFLTWPES